ncbi:uncharacterized protein LOC128213830 [Mya arenaria]|uniref:uncharacterized protein LOC128213830 n=1 Tax=Mya arenaria TaxID=6604 RepID=UPI0022E7AB8C|nr:uncharacterized protein LOC128213830 [Mya arenaria]
MSLQSEYYNNFNVSSNLSSYFDNPVLKENIELWTSVLNDFKSTQLTLDDPITIVLLSLYVPIFVTSLVGNILVLLVMVPNQRMRTVTNNFLVNLAVADLLEFTMSSYLDDFALEENNDLWASVFDDFKNTQLTFDDPITIILMALYVPIFVTSLVSNILVLLVIRPNQRMWTVTNNFLFTIAVARSYLDNPVQKENIDLWTSVLNDFKSTQLTLDDPITIALLSLYVPIFVTSLVGNILVLLVMVPNQRMRTVTNNFLVNLAVADLLEYEELFTKVDNPVFATPNMEMSKSYALASVQ